MGWCHEFGPQIRTGCDHPMAAGDAACHCVSCGTSCEGRFKGCDAVWARGPVRVPLVAPVAPARPGPDGSGVQPPPAPSSNGGEPAAAPPPPLPEPEPSRRRPEQVLYSVSTALETVGAELRAMRTAIDGRGASPATGATEAVLERVTELLDQLPGRVKHAIREAVAPQPPDGPPERPPADLGESPSGLS